ncbi:hypothetical protein FQA39_LY06942 [Lamprigera yunnana]|nr:hypothetical protein FQA39_LY06942 [Lamprigera yunnana]
MKLHEYVLDSLELAEVGSNGMGLDWRSDKEILFNSESNDAHQPVEGEETASSEDDANNSRIPVQKQWNVSNLSEC